MTLGLFVCAFLIAVPSVSAQNAHQMVYMKAAKKESAQLAQKLNLDEARTEHMQRYIYDYHLRMDQRVNPTGYGKILSKDEIDKQLYSRVGKVLTAKQLSQFKEMKADLLKIDYPKKKKIKTNR